MTGGPGHDVPPGYRPVDAGGGFIAANGPLYLLHEGKAVKVGFRVEPRHCNPMGVCHGGMLASFCDMLLPLSVHRKSAEVGQRFLPTVSLQLDYLAPVPLGAWVEGECEGLKVTRTRAAAAEAAASRVCTMTPAAMGISSLTVTRLTKCRVSPKQVVGRPTFSS